MGTRRSSIAPRRPATHPVPCSRPIPVARNAVYVFTTSLWLSDVEAAAWVFATVPPEISDEIADVVTSAGFGSVRVEATIGATIWQTSLFPDTTRGAHILPVKKSVRTAESIDIGDEVTVELTLVE